ncbi:hypothetical protein [Actinoallomurus soli]|uniref:hypothetical protein n=1 Tax=Actinoallomurus soli TaxID=2952535 RepID=UPI002093AA7D|nr:hypothetical protein [Actinoallomurus soli]MCO5969126.1 hypothetical protein [Actinoallomurus soli]
MNDPRLDPETAERLLRGEHTSPTELAEILAAASTAPVDEDPRREEAAVAAFHDARTRHHRRLPIPRVLLTAKAALIAVLLALTGGIAAVAASQHVPLPTGHHHSRGTHQPRRSPAPTATDSPSPGALLPPTSPGRSPSHGHSGEHPKHSHKPHPARKHPTKKKPKGKPSTHQPPGRSSHRLS